jgi:hypothetical protein
VAKLLVTGGRNSPNAANMEYGTRSEAGILLRVDTETGDVEKLLEHVTDPDLLARHTPKPGTTFKCGELHGDCLYLTTEYEVLVVEVGTWRILKNITLPVFNDVHSVTRYGEDLLVTSTGLDAVFLIDHDGNILREWSTLDDGDIWDRFDKEVDYRKVLSTKPHAVHPNFCTVVGEDIWVTRFEKLDAMCLTDGTKKRISFEAGKPHDGHLIGGLVYYTTVTGHIYVADPSTQEIVRHIDFNEYKKGIRPLGWARGMCISNGKINIAFSRLRPTRYTDNLTWVKDIRRHLSLTASHPTRIRIHDLESAQLEREINLEPHGINLVFSVLDEAGEPEKS